MTFELPEKGDAKTTEKAELFSFTGSSLNDDLDSIRTAGDKLDTSKEFLPAFRLTGLDTVSGGEDSTTDGDVTRYPIDPIDPADPIDLQKWQYNNWLRGGDELDFDPDLVKSPEKLDDRFVNELASETDRVDTTIDEKSEVRLRTIDLGDGTQIRVDKDGRVQKITYKGADGKMHTINKPQWDLINGEEQIGDVTVNHDVDFTRFQLPNGKEIRLDEKGRFIGYR